MHSPKPPKPEPGYRDPHEHLAELDRTITSSTPAEARRITACIPP